MNPNGDEHTENRLPFDQAKVDFAEYVAHIERDEQVDSKLAQNKERVESLRANAYQDAQARQNAPPVRKAIELSINSSSNTLNASNLKNKTVASPKQPTSLKMQQSEDAKPQKAPFHNPMV